MKVNMLKQAEKDILENPFIDYNERVAFQALYIMFKYCKSSRKCCDKCFIKKYIKCEGRNSTIPSPPAWGFFNISDDTLKKYHYRTDLVPLHEKSKE